MKTRKMLFWVFLILLVAPFSVSASYQDVSGAKDHPLISRYQGSYITHFNDTEYDEYPIVLGKILNRERKFEKEKTIEGKIIRITYLAPEETSSLQLHRNLENALKNGGFKFLFSCKGDACGKGDLFSSKLYKEKMPKEMTQRHKQYWNVMFLSEFAYLVAQKTQGGKDIYVAVGMGIRKKGYGSAVAKNGKYTFFKKDRLCYAVDVVETATMKQDMVTVNVDYLQNALEIKGKVPLYGIYFDTGKADIKPESDNELQVIADYLKAHPGIYLYVTGHTDDTGQLGYNMKLSEQRAQAVVEALTNDYAIKATRLTAMGVGPVSPVSTNETEKGRSLNRRVELVKKLK